MFIYNTELDDCLTIISPKIYNIYLTDKGNELSKIMLYLKKKFSVPLSEIKQFCLRDKILLRNSDAHYLEHMLEPNAWLALPECTPECLIAALNGEIDITWK